MIRCPQCENEEDFAISAVEYVTAYVTQYNADGERDDTGALEVYDTKNDGGTEWDESSMCRCLNCEHTDTLARFDVPVTTKEETV